MLSLTCQTAIRAVIYLASKFETGGRSGIKEIADLIDASEHTVGKLLQNLVREEVISSSKGPGGGFYITSKQKNLPVLSIIEAIDGKEVFDQCGLGLSRCSTSHPCPIHNDYKIIRDQFRNMCRQKKVSDLCDAVNDGRSYLMG